jgi:phosphate transport system permease protein
MKNPQPTLPTPASAYGARARSWNWRRALSPTGNTGDAVFRAVLFACAFMVLLIVAAMIAAMASNSRLSLREFGFGFLTSSEWNPVSGRFGALPFIYGTVVSSLLALLISVPLSLGIAVFLVEQAPRRLARPLTFLVELLAAIPSVVYGLWGIFVLAPVLRQYVEPALARWLGWTPFFQGSITGIGLLTGGIILAIMITPIISAVVRDVLAAVPVSQREAALALGAPQWRVTTGVVLPAAASGIATGAMLAVARVSGETAPLLFTAFGSRFFNVYLDQPIASLTVQIFNYAVSPYDEWHAQAWAATLVLMTLILVINVSVRVLTRKRF